MSGTVDALLPLSFLEAVRLLDRRVVDPDTELVDELRNKRLGLSDTVHAQIARYADAAGRSRRLARDEVAALAHLIGRRPDADAVFRAAGRLLAERAYRRLSGPTRAVLRVLPRLIARPIALRHVRRLVRRYFAGTMQRAGAELVLEVPDSLTAPGTPRGVGCAYYETGLHELLRLLSGADRTVEHVRCAGRHEGRCEWRVTF